jgi:AAA domain
MKIEDVLAQLRGVRRAGEGWTARCPTHDDSHNSLSISVSADGKLLIRCHANAGCTYYGILAALEPSANGNGARRIVAIYDYRDENGALLCQSVRYEPKDFRQRRPDSTGGHIWKLKDVRRVLYRLPELLQSNRQATVFIVEGEKDADRLASFGLTATTNIGGAGKRRAEYSEPLRGRHVCILPDNDEAGAQHAAQVARALHGVAAHVKIVRLPDLPPKGDVSDYLHAGGTIEQLNALVADALEWMPDASQDTAQHRAPRFHFTTLDDLLAEPDGETAYVWDRTLPRGGFSICAAKPKVGKSTLARNLAVAVSRGLDFLGRATIQGKVIYLCHEEKRDEVKAHFRRMNAQGTDIIIHFGRAPDDALAALETAIEEHAPALVIIDPLSRFCRIKDYNGYELTYDLEPLVDLARNSKCQCHIQALHHNGKGEREGGDAVLGSTAFFGAVDALLTMKRRERARTLESTQRYGEDLPETVIHLDAETGLVTAGGAMQAVILAERKQAVLDCLAADELLSEADLKERIGGNQVHTAKAIRLLYEAGMLRRSGEGRRGKPYLYGKQDAQSKSAPDDSNFSDFSDFTDIEKLESEKSKWMPDCSDEAREYAAIREIDYKCDPLEAERLARQMFKHMPF